MKTIIKQAKKYVLVDNKKVVNRKTKKEIKIKDGKVRLYTDENKRKVFEVKDLIKTYEFKIKNQDEIERIKSLLSKGQTIQFKAYRSKVISSAEFIADSCFGDKYPAAKVRFDGKTKLISYLNIIL